MTTPDQDPEWGPHGSKWGPGGFTRGLYEAALRSGIGLSLTEYNAAVAQGWTEHPLGRCSDPACCRPVRVLAEQTAKVEYAPDHIGPRHELASAYGRVTCDDKRCKCPVPDCACHKAEHHVGPPEGMYDDPGDEPIACEPDHTTVTMSEGYEEDLRGFYARKQQGASSDW